MRILHVLGAMNRGGVETWLMDVLRNIDRSLFCFDFMVHTAQPAAYDEEAKKLGSRIIACPNPQKALRYGRTLKCILREYGPYDAIHSHVHHFSGWVLRLAREAGVPIRVAHSHSDTRPVDSKAKVIRKVYLGLMKRWIGLHATAGVAASEEAGLALWGSNWRRDPRWRILYCGIDLRSFHIACEKSTVREEFGIPEDAHVIGHVGRFDSQKNHGFMLKVLEFIVRQKPDVWLLLVGGGRLRHDVEREAISKNIGDRVVFAELRDDVPRVLLGAMDVFLLPSLCEGLPVAVLEAQAAGLRCLCADNVTREVSIVPGAVEFLPLAVGPQVWADRVLTLLDEPRHHPEYARDVVTNSPFAIENSVAALCRFYNEVA
jgi:glycosyltransferase involved in cell wall biosynthesis